MFSTIGLILVAGTDEIGDRQETRATEPMLKAARYSRLPAGSPITKNDHMCRYVRARASDIPDVLATPHLHRVVLVWYRVGGQRVAGSGTPSGRHDVPCSA